MEYPEVRRDESVVEDHFGIEIKDPYRWLEDPDSEETKKFVEEQNKITFKYINEYENREKLMDKLLEKYNYERFGCTFKRGKGENEYYYFFHNTGLQAQSVLFRQKTLDSEPVVFFDPNTLSDDGTVALSYISFSDSGKYFAYSLSKSGSDWVKIYITQIEDGKLVEIDKPLDWVKFSGITWTKDEKGIFYQRYPKPNISENKSAGTETDQNSNAMTNQNLLNLLMNLRLHNVGSTFFFKTSKDSPQYKIVKININDSEKKFIDVIPQNKHVIDTVLFCNNNSFVINYLYDAQLFYSVTSFINPGTVYRCDLRNNSCKEIKRNVVKNYNPDDFVVKQKFYPSKDGTNIPMFIVHKKYVVANIRGGGEYGETWYESGKLDNKQNVFDDFQWAAKYLINLKYTSPEKLCINGGSNGGLLVGACINQAPELFGCAVADVGVMDMLRFHKFTIGHAWISDYGDPDKEHDFKTVLNVPLHSLKLISQLQYVAGKSSKKPLLIRIDTKAGHGGGKPVKKRIEEATDKISFINKNINAEWCD
ncbi:hypothetical protein PIROE2DRAFT_62807 [Piromyces sp. E2]|nr:hypothetical protein PIROE2DRAFT_62807 [Piromyces sp. E2]|eukprot:OUM60973.1 hypothetical protein PIROE2DRAFT_62807 [Piromyces sp. E2]